MVNARDKRAADKERLQAERAKAEVALARQKRRDEIKIKFPSADDRVKEALKCPHVDYPEMDNAQVDEKMDFFDISKNKYYKMKAQFDLGVATAEHEASLKEKIRRQQDFNDGLAADENAIYSGGDSSEVRERIAANLQGRLPGRERLFSDATIAAAKAEFLSRVTSIKRGMANHALKELLLRKRTELQSAVGRVLEDPSDSCLEDAIKMMDIGDPVSADPATKDRADALEDYRNAVSCAAMWTAIQKMKIAQALIFSLDEVSCWLTQRGTKIRFCRYPKGMVEEGKKRRLTPGTQVKKSQPRCMYVECMSNAEGDLACTVVRCVDESVPKDMYLLKPVDADQNLFICFVNKDVDKAAYSKTMMTRIWLPKIRARQQQATVYMRETANAADVCAHDSPAYSQNTGEADFTLQPGETEARAILTFDGAYEHIEAIMTGSMADYCRKHNIGLFKWAAGCSLVQQPADVCKCHKLLHAYFKRPKFVYNVDVTRKDLKASFRPAMAVLDRHKANAATKATFTRFFYHLPNALASAFIPANIVEGFSICGVHPFDVDKIMTGWNPGGPRAKSCWGMLLPQEQNYFRVAIEALSEVALANGFVSDEDIEGCVVDASSNLTLGQLMSDAAIPDYLKCQVGGTKLTPGKGINRRRCILMTHASWLVKERTDRRALPPKVVDIYGKEFELKNCKCGSKAFSSVANHVKLGKHQAHCAALVAKLRAEQEVPSELDDSAVTLARKYFRLNPVAAVAGQQIEEEVDALGEVREGEEMGFAARFDGEDAEQQDAEEAASDGSESESDDCDYYDGDDDNGGGSGARQSSKRQRVSFAANAKQ